MGNRTFEIPCADRKTREKNLLNKFDRSKLYEENNEKPPRSQRILNQVENIIHFHERKTSKNSDFIESNKKKHTNVMQSPSEQLSSFESNDIDSIKVDFSNQRNIINQLNMTFLTKEVNYIIIF